LVVETLFDAVTAGGVIVWALATGVLPTHQLYTRLPDVDWKFVLRHERLTLYVLGALAILAVVAWLLARARVAHFKERVRQGFAILRDRGRFVRSVLLPQAVSWLFRVAALFPATPGGAGTKQGLTELLFRGRGESHTLLLAFSVGMNIAITVVNLVM